MTPTPKTKMTEAAITRAFNGLPPEDRDKIMARVRNRDDAGEILASLNKEVRIAEKDHQRAVDSGREQVAALESIRPWLYRTSFQLEANDCSRIHKLHEAFRAGRVINVGKTLAPPDTTDLMGQQWINGNQPFVVQHDWAAAFKNATDYADGPFRLPYDLCAFEFRISGVTVIVMVTQPEAEGILTTPNRFEDIEFSGPHFSMPFIQCAGGYWYCVGQRCEDQWMKYAWKQIRAICIALDAEVATHDTIRAPAAVNDKRNAKGAPPLHDFHIVKLRGREARQLLPSAGGTHRSPRMHFRRGHWRHFATHKTWIRWMLVGNPELGFIDKAYRL